MREDCAVIMRSKNERPYLDHSLEALHKQTYDSFYLYNIDSGSTDGSLEVIQQWNRNPKRIVQIPPEDYVPGKVLNKMIAMTKEPLIVLLNADAIPQSDTWLEKLLEPILANTADATMSRQIPRKEARFIVAYDLLRAYDPSNVLKHPCFFSAVACAFRRALWEETKFYTEGYSEDILWRKTCEKKGARFVYVPESIVEHSHNYTLSEWHQRNVIEGAAESYIFGAQASIFLEGWKCFREVTRDLLYAVKKGRIDTIPYNLLYRFVGHKGAFQGKKQH